MSTNALPAGAADEGRMTLIEHLIELRRRIIVCAIAIGLFAVVGWFLYPWISDFLLRPYRDIASRSIAGGNLIATSPVEGFAVRMKITLYVGIALAMPVILWQIWRFVTPGLYTHERRYAWPFVVSGVDVVRVRRDARVLDAAEGARLPQCRRRQQHHAGLHGGQVLPAHRRT